MSHNKRIIRVQRHPYNRTPDHHTEQGFCNPKGSPVQSVSGKDYWSHTGRKLLQKSRRVSVPEGHVLKASDALKKFDEYGNRDSITWLGHAAFFLRISNLNILLDPFLEKRASPIRWFGPKRYAGTGIPQSELPNPDVIVITHNHYDHLCSHTLRQFQHKDKVIVVVPLGVGGLVRRIGFKEVYELDWYDTIDIDDVHIKALPCIHWSQRTLKDTNRTLWCGYSVLTKHGQIYYAGDTGFGPVFEEVARNIGVCDYAILPIGTYEPRVIMKAHHVSPEEAAEIGKIVGAKTLIAKHWGTIRLSEEKQFEAPDRFRLATKRNGHEPEDVWVLKIGETRPLNWNQV